MKEWKREKEEEEEEEKGEPLTVAKVELRAASINRFFFILFTSGLIKYRTNFHFVVALSVNLYNLTVKLNVTIVIYFTPFLFLFLFECVESSVCMCVSSLVLLRIYFSALRVSLQ